MNRPSTLIGRGADPDVQARRPHTEVSLTRVGVTGVEKVIRINPRGGDNGEEQRRDQAPDAPEEPRPGLPGPLRPALRRHTPSLSSPPAKARCGSPW